MAWAAAPRRRPAPAFARPAAARPRNYSKRTLVQGGVRTLYLEKHVPRHYCATLARVLRVPHVRPAPERLLKTGSYTEL